MMNFFYYIKAYHRNTYGRIKGQVAMALPENYGWGRDAKTITFGDYGQQMRRHR
jgi:hypothetical protein